jgi:hypothetical protein
MMNAKHDVPLSDKTTATPEAEKGWWTTISKAMQWKTKAADADNMSMETACKKTLMKQNGE